MSTLGGVRRVVLKCGLRSPKQCRVLVLQLFESAKDSRRESDRVVLEVGKSNGSKQQAHSMQSERRVAGREDVVARSGILVPVSVVDLSLWWPCIFLQWRGC